MKTDGGNRGYEKKAEHLRARLRSGELARLGRKFPAVDGHQDARGVISDDYANRISTREIVPIPTNAARADRAHRESSFLLEPLPYGSLFQWPRAFWFQSAALSVRSFQRQLQYHEHNSGRN